MADATREKRATPDLLGKLLEAAEAHGKESEAEHEVGDLQGILFSCWKQLTSKQQRSVYEENEAIVTEWLSGT